MITSCSENGRNFQTADATPGSNLHLLHRKCYSCFHEVSSLISGHLGDTCLHTSL